MVRGLIGAVNVDGGPTPQQFDVLNSITAHLWNRPDLVPSKMIGLTPRETAERLQETSDRRCFHEVLIALEVCRHPLTQTQVDAVESFAEALKFDGPDLKMFRDLVSEGASSAAEDYNRFLAANLEQRSEPSLVSQAGRSSSGGTAPEPDLVQRLEAFQELAPASLGRAFLSFYRRHRIPLPGVQASSMNHFYMAHDMTHVIAGIEPTGPGEVALSAFQWAMNDNSVNSAALLASLVVHEAGFGQAGTLTTESGQLGVGGAAQLLGEEMSRGSHCSSDFSLVDHFELVAVPLTEVRESFGVQPPEDPHDGHHCW
jgi:hypothetical protein